MGNVLRVFQQLNFALLPQWQETSNNHRALLNVQYKARLPYGFIMLACNESIQYQFYYPESMHNGIAVSKE